MGQPSAKMRHPSTKMRQPIYKNRTTDLQNETTDFQKQDKRSTFMIPMCNENNINGITEIMVIRSILPI